MKDQIEWTRVHFALMMRGRKNFASFWGRKKEVECVWRGVFWVRELCLFRGCDASKLIIQLTWWEYRRRWRRGRGENVALWFLLLRGHFLMLTMRQWGFDCWGCLFVDLLRKWRQDCWGLLWRDKGSVWASDSDRLTCVGLLGTFATFLRAVLVWWRGALDVRRRRDNWLKGTCDIYYEMALFSFRSDEHLRGRWTGDRWWWKCMACIRSRGSDRIRWFWAVSRVHC